MSYVPIPFRNLTLGSTAVAVKGSPGNLFGYNIISTDAAANSYIKFYDKAAAGVNPASDVPRYTFLLPAAGSITVRGADEPFNFGTAISVRCVTGSGDTNTTAPATPPIVELDYY